jgi:hypothetical protein
LNANTQAITAGSAEQLFRTIRFDDTLVSFTLSGVGNGASVFDALCFRVGALIQCKVASLTIGDQASTDANGAPVVHVTMTAVASNRAVRTTHAPLADRLASAVGEASIQQFGGNEAMT